jgi:hypothetical protein
LALPEVGEKSKIPDYKIKAVAEMWLSLDIIQQQLTIWANQVEQSAPSLISDGPD